MHLYLTLTKTTLYCTFLIFKVKCAPLLLKIIDLFMFPQIKSSTRHDMNII